MQSDGHEGAALEIGVEPHAVVGDGDVLDAADDGGDERRVVLRAQHRRVHQHGAQHGGDEKVEQKLAVRPAGELKHLPTTGECSQIRTH